MGSSSVSKLYLCLWSQALILWTKPYSTDYALKRQTVINSCTLRRCFPADVGENWWWDYRLTCFNPCTTSAFDSFLLSLLIFVCTCHRTQSITANTQNQTMRITITVQFLTFSFLSTMWGKYIMINARAKWSFFESIYVLITTLDVLLILLNWYFPRDFQQPKQSSYHVQRTMKKKKNVYLHGLKICTKIKRGWKWHGYYELILCIVFNFTPELCKLKNNFLLLKGF